MNTEQPQSTTNKVAIALQEGFAMSPKKLPSWLFYDRTGDKIFTEIMEMPSYYLSRCESEIFTNQYRELGLEFSNNGKSFDLIELGAGDGRKTEVLLHNFLDSGIGFRYIPIDISPNVLKLLESRLEKNLPGLNLRTIAMDYQETELLFNQLENSHRKVILFLGSNIGNMDPNNSVRYIAKIADSMNEEDLLMVGFDLVKDPRIILNAYDDPEGITARFNYNILDRLNRELDANFDSMQFSHYPLYDPAEATAKSYLISKRDQEITIGFTGSTYRLKKWECIQTEMSQKYSDTHIKELAAVAGLSIYRQFEDSKGYYRNVLFSKTPAS